MTTGTSDCGLKYAVLKSGNAVAYCALGIKCGTRDEEGFHSGIAHFTEHTIFRGTKKRSASVINNYLDRLGGDLNAFTNKEEIVIHSTVLKEDLPKAVGLLMELATSPTFPEDEIETERGVVIDEIISYKDSPSDDVYDRFEEEFFKGHPLGKPILGTTASVKKITSEELRKFVAEKFIPSRMVLTVVSPDEEKKTERLVKRLIDKYFSSSSETATEERILSHPSNPVFFKKLEKHNHEVNAVIGSSAPSLYDGKDRISTVLLANILGGPASNSLLNSELREKNGWVYGVECNYTQYADSGLFTISFGCDRPNLDKCLDAIKRIIKNLREKPLSEAKLKAAKKQLIAQLSVASESGEAKCLSMGKSLLAFGKINSDKENRAEIESVTSDDILEMAGRILAEDHLSTLIYL
ncbi:MAG: insulinase family protein [Bacteroidales bacterium]|nr:insulinase family protein [Bacteroidales bacterium]MBQ3846747.1 insulinase family protein [Bacteroidales bacterium]